MYPVRLRCEASDRIFLRFRALQAGRRSAQNHELFFREPRGAIFEQAVRPDAAAEDLMCPAVTAIEIRTDLRHTTGSGHRLPPTIPRNKSSETTHCRVDANR